nr:MAG TPA: hypothetical protein [Caudoviricetes sp.]
MRMLKMTLWRSKNPAVDSTRSYLSALPRLSAVTGMW